MGGAEEELPTLAVDEKENDDEREVDEGWEFDEEAEGGDQEDGGEFCDGGVFGVVPEQDEKGDGEENEQGFRHEGSGQIEVHGGEEKQKIGPWDGTRGEGSFPERLEEQECGDPEEERGQSPGGVERYKRKCGMKSDDA